MSKLLGNLNHSLPSLAMGRPVTVFMLVLTFIGLGAISGSRMSLDFLPSMDLPFLGCFIPYPGATPAQVEQEIAIPAEGEFQTLSQLKRLYTSSSTDGCFISFNFESGTDMPGALADVRDRIERLRLELPDGVDRVYIRHFSADEMPIMAFSLAREGDRQEFGELVRKVLVPKLQRLDGVADIELHGAEEESILIEFDQNALRSHNFSIYQIISTLRTNNINVSVGELADGKTKYLVRTLGEFERPAEMEDLMIGNGLRLKDVAEVGYRERERDFIFSIDGKDQVILLLKKESEANTVATCERVMDEVDRVLATPLFTGVSKFLFFNQGDIIVSALNGLRKAGTYGGALALLVLFLFIGRFRPTSVVAPAIPGSLVAGLIFMYFKDMTLNLVTMMSLIIAIGMVVDNSIVVVENIYRYMQMGYSPKESAQRGAAEVGLAITAATATTGVVFLPVFFMEAGQMNVFMREFALPVTVALAASLVIALTVIPLAISRFVGLKLPSFPRMPAFFVRKGPGQENAPRKSLALTQHRIPFFSGPKSPFRWFMSGYLFLLHYSIKKRLATTVFVAAIIGLTYYVPVRQLGIQSMPSADRRQVDINVRFDPNYDLAQAKGVFTHIETFIEERSDELGVHNIFSNYSARGGSIQLFLKRPKDLELDEEIPYSSEDVMNILWAMLPERIPGARLRFSTGSSSTGASSGQARVSLRLQGDDAALLDQYADRLIDVINSMPGLTEADKSTRDAEQEIQLQIDEAVAYRSGINPTAIAQTVSFSLLGTRLPEMKREGREVQVWAQFREEDRKTRANLDNVMVLGAEGAMVPVNQLVDYTRAESPQQIRRLNGKNYIWVTAKTPGADLMVARAQLTKLSDSFDLPPGYTLSMGDEILDIEASMASFFGALLLAIILIYIVMGALFESFLLPLSILTSVPLAFIGVYWILFAFDTPLDTIAFIGCILMVGIVVNNGIVIVDHINNLRGTGLTRYDAIIQAGKDRIRPVLMTAITTILGAIPLAIGGGINQQAVTSLGKSMIGGLASGTVLTLFIVPLFYTFIDDLQGWGLRFVNEVRRLGKGDTAKASRLKP